MEAVVGKSQDNNDKMLKDKCTLRTAISTNADASALSPENHCNPPKLLFIHLSLIRRKPEVSVNHTPLLFPQVQPVTLLGGQLTSRRVPVRLPF